jgi:DNA-binding HxlR family transcriptional regulator
MFIGRNTYSDFLNAPEKISTNILVDRLKKLTQYGIIEYTKNSEDKK